MAKQEATNSFTGGLVSDLNPITTPPTVLTDCLNGTLLTFNGNELVLQNDMGNTPITGAQLSDGFIPLGVKESGGIIYIVSYNPVSKKTEIGSFPSPIILSDDAIALTLDINLDAEGTTLNKNFILSDKTLNSGDSFVLFLKNDDLETYISSLASSSNRKFYRFKLISVENGIESDITDTLSKQYKLIGSTFVEQDYWFVPLTSSETVPSDMQQYVDGNYVQRYKARKRGKIALKILPETIDQFYINNTTNFPVLTLLNSSGVYDGNLYLKFNFYIEALSQIKADTIKIKMTLINLDGVSADVNVPISDITVTMSPTDTIKDNITTSVSIGTSYNMIASYTIECWNLKYGIHFSEFDITDLINLSIDPSNWGNATGADYYFYDYNLLDYQTI